MVVLATKVYVRGDARTRAIDSLGSLVDNLIGELSVTTEIGIRHDDFPSVTITGADATAARNVLADEWGTIPGSLEEGETYIGTLESWDEDGMTLDAGVPVQIPTKELGLGPGTPAQVIERFGLVQHQRLRFVAGDPATLADGQRDSLYEWQRGAGRLNVNSVTRAEVRRTVNRAGHATDIVGIDRLGLLEQSVVCAPDTDPPGLLASVGPYLPGEMRCVIP